MTTKPAIPVTVKDITAEFQVKVDEIDALLADIYSVVKRGMIEKFKLNGGCERCKGRGFRKFYEFGESYSERCVCDGAKSGIVCPDDDDKYIPNYADDVTDSDLWHAMTDTLVEERATYMLMVAAGKSHMNPKTRQLIGQDVLVIKGRKVLPGTVGRVEYVNARQYDIAVVLVTADGKKYTTSLYNVEVIYDRTRHDFK